MKCLNAELRLSTVFIVLLVSVSMIAGCKKDEVPPVIPTVTVSAPLEQEVSDWDEYSGRLEAPRAVTVAARVSGVIMQAPFQEGSLVNEGDPLFVIDERIFRADLSSKKADTLKAQSQEALAEIRFRRYDRIHATKAISDEEYDQAVASLQQARAQVQAAKAAEDLAQLNLQWATVTAPITGRISRKFVTEGNLVNGGQGQATQLTTIMSIDPLYASINVPERSYLNYQALASKRKEQPDYHIPAELQLENESGFPHKGFIDFIDNLVDTGTGTIQLRAQIANPDGALTPGLFMRIRILASDPYKTILVPDAAIGTDQNSRYVLLVGKENTVELRPVKLGRLFGDKRSILEGLKLDDRVIVKGLQAARPGTKVNPVEAPAAEGAAK